ncbi:type II toxin-antitoxin system Phd/YefM family antitoxin [Paracraurococcus lichenis]|uniref:Antitoxin n=1 Tax=Paracraurococcus lichenis TaxID=3064888 RepID=A0ABT9DSQ4_9PROT|nr:type II toxin-antitoxin system prevent-host-death family antitoxin [Paracraurococcus sp. LOR1-02]MDO9706927.1 type II toxin-antitoxin system prevent-host-death family antitoxin [Paracraurococcus sp. LOR1-02]
MKSVTVYEAKTHLSALLAEVEAGAEVLITRHGRPVARLSAAAPAAARLPGDWAGLPGWEGFRYDPAAFAPLTPEQAAAEGWDG